MRATRRRGEAFEIPMLTMFCLAMRRGAWEAIGPLDESFGVGTLEDDDYSMRARRAGLRLLCAEDVLVHHFGEGSFGKLFEGGRAQPTCSARNRRRFEEKWGEAWQPYRRRRESRVHGARREPQADPAPGVAVRLDGAGRQQGGRPPAGDRGSARRGISPAFPTAPGRGTTPPTAPRSWPDWKSYAPRGPNTSLSRRRCSGGWTSTRSCARRLDGRCAPPRRGMRDLLPGPGASHRDLGAAIPGPSRPHAGTGPGDGAGGHPRAGDDPRRRGAAAARAAAWGSISPRARRGSTPATTPPTARRRSPTWSSCERLAPNTWSFPPKRGGGWSTIRS